MHTQIYRKQSSRLESGVDAQIEIVKIVKNDRIALVCIDRTWRALSGQQTEPAWMVATSRATLVYSSTYATRNTQNMTSGP
jgi:hypothetical protein